MVRLRRSGTRTPEPGRVDRAGGLWLGRLCGWCHAMITPGERLARLATTRVCRAWRTGGSCPLMPCRPIGPCRQFRPRPGATSSRTGAADAATLPAADRVHRGRDGFDMSEAPGHSGPVARSTFVHSYGTLILMKDGEQLASSSRRTRARRPAVGQRRTWPGQVIRVHADQNRDRAGARQQRGDGLQRARAQPPSNCLTRGLALPKSIWPAKRVFSSPITLPMSFMPLAPVSAITAAMAALASASSICFGM